MKDKWTAIVLAMILGGLGVHKFYLKQPVLGIIYLFLCWTFIPSIVAFMEGVIWIIQDDNKFNEKYNGFKAR